MKAYSQTLYPFQDSTTELYGFTTRSKEVKIATQFHAVAHDKLNHCAFVVDNDPDAFADGLCRIVKNGKIGYVNTR